MSYRIPPRVAHLVEQGDQGDQGGGTSEGDTTPRVYLMRLPDGRPRQLEGSAAVIWLAVAEEGISTPEAVAELFDGDPDEVVTGVRGFLVELLSSGLLTADEDGA